MFLSPPVGLARHPMTDHHSTYLDQSEDTTTIMGCINKTVLPYTLRIPIAASTRLCKVACERAGHSYATYSYVSL